MRDYVPPPTPKQVAEARAWRIKALIWILAIPFMVFTLMAIGYSDLAPNSIRRAVMQIDQLFGSPVWSLLDPRS